MDQNLFEDPFLLLLFMECFYYGSLITETSLATVFEAIVKSSKSHRYLIGKTTLHHGDMLKIGFFPSFSALHMTYVVKQHITYTLRFCFKLYEELENNKGHFKCLLVSVIVK